ncbi:MAG TPA: GNAT family N-acetyltransferase [Pirellulaceae bacterium]|jgi:ribosomal protein S18 acetylase RimI-like enzyme|nr:GNAT family N-acetyltransferase [Pirellulaceae bacterium]
MSATRPPLLLRYEPTSADVEAVRALVARTAYFNAEEVGIAAELVEERLAKGEDSGYEFVLAHDEVGKLLGYACFGKIPCTTNRYDLYWIAVDPERQGRGLGRELLRASEDRIVALGGARVYVDTSTRPQYASTRAFYERCGYELDAALECFYGPGDGKAIYRRILKSD